MLLRLKNYSYSNNRLFYRTLVKLAIPMGFTFLLNSLLNLVDNIMISGLGETAVAALGSANRLFFLMMLTLFGVYSGFGVFVSQYWGKKDLKRLQTVYLIAIVTGVIISSVATLIAVINPRIVIDFFSDDPVVIELGIKYLRVVAFSYVFSAIIFSIQMVSRSTEKVKLPMTVSIIGVATNTVLNLILIFGLNVTIFNIHIEIVEMGVVGAALATVISRILQVIIYLTYIIFTKNEVLFLKISNFVVDPILFKRMFQKALPVVINEFFWSLGVIMVFKAYSTLGTQAQASVQLFETIVGLLTVFNRGVSNASAIMIGKRLGEKNIEEAKKYASLFIFNSLLFGTITGLVMISIIPVVPILHSILPTEYQNLSPVVLQNIQHLLFILAFFMPFKLLAATFVVGILRSGGDTLFGFLVEGSTLWGYAVLIAFILVLFTNLPLPIIFLFVCFEDLIKDFVCYMRFKSGKYLHNLVH